MSEQVINLSGYKFTPLDQLKERRQDLLDFCRAHQLRGTILLSEEGINLFVAGVRTSVDALLAKLKETAQLADFEAKESIADRQPFNRMLVKIKKEIIAFGVESINPAEYTSEHLPARELHQWLAEKRPIQLLDVRNTYESEIGSFAGALKMEIDHFRDFPEKVKELPDDWKDQPVVTFCTGGIRCEKAAPFLEQAGFTNVYQLDGGILKYFEECGGEFYDGECFVFDQRVALDPRLAETETSQCYACQATLSADDRSSPLYEVGKSCPHCHHLAEQSRQTERHQKNKRLAELAQQLPGSQPYDNYRPVNVPLKCDGMKMADFLHSVHSHISLADWQKSCENGRLVRDKAPIASDHIVHAGERYHHLFPATVEPDVNANIEILFDDEAIVVVNKPAPLPMHPCGRFNRNSLAYLLNEVYAPIVLRPAHRLDANTSGIVVFSCTKQFARQIQPQFERGEVDKCYRVRVLGHPPSDTFTVDRPVGRERLAGGLRNVDDEGLPALTRFEVVQRLDDNTSLLLAYPKTGRTNQIRVHLWDAGFPVMGDPVYLQNQELGELQTLGVDQPPMCLQSARLGFVHPLHGSRQEYEAVPQTWWCI